MSPRTDRAVSSPVGFALVLVMIVAGTVVVLAVGAAAIEDTKGTLDGDRAEKVLTQLDSQAAMVALGNSRVQRIPLSGSRTGRFVVGDDAGWMNVTVTNATSGTTDTLMNATLGKIQYTDGIRTVAYQGGGVWKRQQGGSVMISPPEFYYRDATLTLPLVTVDGDASLGDEAVVSKSDTAVRHFPNESADRNRTNPLAGGTVTVTIQSDYYRAWGGFFEQRTDGTASFDHEAETVTLTLVVPAGEQTVTNAIAATSAAGQISLSGSGSDTSRTDSYNSSAGDGTYADTRTDEGTIATAGDVSVTGNSIVEGSVRSGGYVEVKGSGEVTRDVSYAEGKHIRGTVGGTLEQIEEVEGAGPIDTIVQSRYEELDETNDNDDVTTITDDSLDDGDQTLESGSYHFDELVVDGETLVLDTGDDGEPIAVGVRDFVQLRNDGRIEINGTSNVRFYVDGQSSTGAGHDFVIEGSGGQVDVRDGENASKLWIYGRKDFSGAIDGTNSGDHRFEGVLYAPGGEIGSSSFRIGKGDLYGGVVTGAVEMDNGGSIHYDQSLQDVRAVPADESIVRLTYLHVSENGVTVTSP